MGTPTDKKPKGSRATPPRGALTTEQREERMTFAISTFRNCANREEQLRAIMTFCKVKRLQATRIWSDAAEFLGQACTDYQKNYAIDQYQFLTGMRADCTVKAADRLQANKQLQDVFGPPKELKVSVDRPAIVVATQVNVLASEKALEAALALEEALVASQPPALVAPEEAKDEPKENL